MILKVNGCICHSLEEIKTVSSPLFSKFVEEWFSSEKYILAHTSGSTGVPKSIYLDKNDMIHSAKMTNEFFNIGSKSRLLLCLSPNYIAGKMMIVRAILADAEIVEEEPSNTPLNDYEGIAFDFAAVVPSQALWLVKNPKILSKIKTMIVGGGVVSDVLRKLIANSTVSAYSTYGMTETCSHVALSKIEPSVQPYLAMHGVSFEQDERGCLVINAPYFTQKKFVTNDIVELQDSVSFIWKGRYDNVINSGGVKIFPEEVEKLLNGIFDCRYYISSKKSEKWGESVVLVLEKELISTSEEKRILHIIKNILPKYSVPKQIICLKKFSETLSKKVIRQKF